MPKEQENGAADRLEELMTAHRKEVVRVYLVIRLLFILVSGFLLWLIAGGVLRLPPWLPPRGVTSQLFDAWMLFSGWSVALFGVGAWALRRSRFRAIDWLIWCSLFVDGFAVYEAASSGGGGANPFYHSVYFLIALHSYHLVAPGSFSARAAANWRSLLRRYVLLSVLPSVVVSMAIYGMLAQAGAGRLDFWLELGLQLITASAFMLLGITNLWRFRSLAEEEAKLAQAQSSQQAARQEVTAAREDLRRTETDLKTARAQQQRLLKALAKVTNIAEMQSEENFSGGLRGLAKEVGETLNAEYCAIGLAHETTAGDVAEWVCCELSREARKQLEAARFVPLEGSLVGTVIVSYRKTFDWVEDEHGDLLDPDNSVLKERQVKVLLPSAAGFREILPTKKIRYLLLTPFYTTTSEEKPLGYLYVINRRGTAEGAGAERFTQADQATLEAIAPQLAIAIENVRSQQRETEIREEQEKFDELAKKQDADDVINGLLAYVNRSAGSRVASLWLPIEDGFGEPKDVRKLLLRAVHVRGEERQVGDNNEIARKLRQTSLHRLDESYLGQFLGESAKLPEISYEPDLSQKPHCWQAYLAEIGTPRLVVIPILDPLPEAFAQESPPPWKGVMAILCLRPIDPDFTMTEAVRERFERFSQQLGKLLLERRLRRRFEQIDMLQQRLRELDVSDLAGFYPRMVHLVRGVMGAEACSLFTTGKAPGMLVLNASTADRANVSIDGKPAQEVATSSCIDQPVFALDDDSLTSATFHHRVPVLVHDTLSFKPDSARFREVTKTTTARSFIASPIVRSDGQVIGVLRCINNEHVGNVMKGFLPSDRDFLALLTGIMARFIESAQFAADKNRFLNELSHELATPLLQAQIRVSFLEKLWRGDRSAKDPMEQFGYLRESLLSVASLARDIQYQYGRTLATFGSYDFSRQIDLHPSIEMIRKPFLHEARIQRACEIVGHTREIPKLYVDKQRIEQVLYNLMQNAIKYSRWAGGPIHIRYSKVRRRFEGIPEEEWHQISVSNFGIGVPEGEEESIFAEYVRGSNTAVVGGGQSGTGLGLAVSRRIVENHGGRLLLLRRESPTVFAIFLPGYLEERAPKHEDQNPVRG